MECEDDDEHGNWSLRSDLSAPCAIPPSTSLQFSIRVVESGVCAPVAILTNIVTLAVIVRGGLPRRNWTYGMIVNLCVAQSLLGLLNVTLNLPGIVTAR